MAPQSDEEKVTPPGDQSASANASKTPADTDDCKPGEEDKPGPEPTAEKAAKRGDKSSDEKKGEKNAKETKEAKKNKETTEVKSDLENINQDILALPIPDRHHDR